jgi:hypothetical protein
MPIINENSEQAIVHLFTAQLVLKKRIEPILRLQQHGALTKSIYLIFYLSDYFEYNLSKTLILFVYELSFTELIYV